MKSEISKILFSVSVLTLFVAQGAFAQRFSNKGDRYFDKNLFEDAIKYYNQEIKSGGDRHFSLYAQQQLAACYRILGEFEMAEETYRKILKKKRNQEDPTNYLNYGKSLKSSAKYAEAKVQFEEYIRLNPSDPMGPIFLYSCDSAQKWLDETLGKEVRNVEKINTEMSDFSPALLASNQLVYSSSREGSKEAFISFDGGMKVNRMDLYSVDINLMNSDEQIKIRNITEVNSPLHEGAATFSKDGNEIYFTRTIKGKKNKRENELVSVLQVFYSKKDSTGKWTEPVSAFPFNSTKYSIGQPSLSADGETIFFISDMVGGYGGTDIYYSEKREDGSWIDPINAGSEVNTFGHELFPYISEQGVLYFSSDTHVGMGKLDIFSSTLTKDGWGNVENLKPPINSIGNDFGIVMDGKYFRGLFSSDRFNGKGAEDIYSFSKDIPLQITLKGDSLKLNDKSIFDGIKYSLTDNTTAKDTSLLAVDGAFTFLLEEGHEYTLSAKRNRFSVKNKINIKIDKTGEERELFILPENQEVFVDVFFFYPQEQPNDSIVLPLKPIPGKTVSLSGNNSTEKVSTNHDGFFSFSHPLQPDNEYKIQIILKKE